MLQGGSSNSELNSVLGALAVQQGVDQAAAEGVAAANAVDDAQLVLLGEAVLVGGNVVFCIWNTLFQILPVRHDGFLMNACIM